MASELTSKQKAIIQETEAVEQVSQFQELRASIDTELKKMLSTAEVQEPAKQVSTILTELRSLYLQVSESELNLKEHEIFRDVIRATATAQYWFGDGLRTGVYRPRPAREVIESSRPWRQRLKLMGKVAFSYNAKLVEEFSDVNSSYTLEEERKDLQALLALVKIYEEVLTAEAGLTPQFIAEGKALFAEVEQRDLFGAVGLLNQEEALTLRNTLLTFAVLFARKVAAKGALASFSDDTARKRFESFTFGSALRRIQERKKSEPTEAPPEEKA